MPTIETIRKLVERDMGVAFLPSLVALTARHRRGGATAAGAE